MAEEFSLATLARAVWGRRGLVALIIVTCVAAAAVVTKLLPKIYRAETSVFFPEPRESGLGAALGALGQGSGLAALAGLAPPSASAGLCKAIAESYSVRAQICRDFGLQKRYQAQQFQDATRKLGDDTAVTITPEGTLVIAVDTAEPRLSADLANAYARIVERTYLDSAVSRARGEREFLQAQLARAEQRLGAAEAALESYQKRGQALLVPEEVPPTLQKLADIRVEQASAQVELESARRQRDEALAQLNRLVAADSGGDSQKRSVYVVPWQQSAEIIADNPDIAELRAKLVALEVELASARHRVSSEHPDYKRLETEVAETRARLAEEARKTVTQQTRTRDPVYGTALESFVTLETETIGQEARTQGLGKFAQQLEAKAAGLPERLLRFSRLEREVRAQETIYATLKGQLEGAKLKELQEQPIFQVLDTAVPPTRHVRPRLAVNLALAFFFGALLALAVAAALGPPRPK